MDDWLKEIHLWLIIAEINSHSEFLKHLLLSNRDLKLDMYHLVFPSVQVHPCGQYRKNSVISILEAEHKTGPLFRILVEFHSIRSPVP